MSAGHALGVVVVTVGLVALLCLPAVIERVIA